MIKFNLLTEGFVENREDATLEFSATELDSLLDVDEEGEVVTSSGDIISLVMDLGFMYSVDKLRYRTTPQEDLSNVTIQYGRTLESLVTASLSTEGEDIVVEPTISGFTFPRYFTLSHTVSQSGMTINNLVVENKEGEINFGEDSSLESITLSSPLTEGYGQIVEIPVVNSGTVATDIFVVVDTSRSSQDVFERLEIAPTATGVFQSLDLNQVPSTIPWEWGHFDNCTVNEDNELEIKGETLAIGASWNPTISSFRSDYRQRAIADVVWNDGTSVLAKMGDTSGGSNTAVRLLFLDFITRSITFAGDIVPYTITGANTNLTGLHFAYDGEDKIYWLRGSSTAGGSPEIYCYSVRDSSYSLVATLTKSHNTYFGKGIIYHEGDLHILGGTSSASANTTTGLKHVKYNLEGGTETSLGDLPTQPLEGATFRYFEGKIYYAVGGATVTLWSYDIEENLWTLLPEIPSGTSIPSMAINPETRELWAVNGDDGGQCTGSNNHAPSVRIFNLDTKTWGTTFIPACGNLSGTSSAITEFEVFLGGSALLFTNGSSSRFKAEVVGETPITVDASWTSPVFLMRQGVSPNGTESFHRMLIDRIDSDSISMIYEDNLSVETFQIRSSSDSPAGDNFTESFTSSGIDTGSYVVGSTGGIFADQNSPQGLEINHTGSSSISAAFLYTNQMFSTSGKMQYKFWWRPPVQKAGSGDEADRSSFYIVPFLDTINTGLGPIRNSNTFRRSNGDYIAIRLGNQTNTTTFTRISVFKGGGGSSGAPDAGTDDYTISANSLRYYEVVFNVDWNSGNYTISFDGVDLGSGNIPLSSRVILQPQHSVEIYSSSTGTGVSFTEYFKHLTVSRVNLEARQDVAASPLHLEDPLYGINGSLEYIPVTVNSSILPVEDYLQAKLSFKGVNTKDRRVVSKIAFPVVIRLADVAPGESKSVFVRYNFPTSNQLIQDEIYLKAYMATDKE